MNVDWLMDLESLMRQSHKLGVKANGLNDLIDGLKKLNPTTEVSRLLDLAIDLRKRLDAY